MKIRILKAVRVSGVEYHPGDVAEFEPSVALQLIREGYGIEEAQTPRPVVQPIVDFDKVGDISEVLPTEWEGEGEQFVIDDLIGVPIVILRATFDKGRAGRLAGKDIAIIEVMREDGTKGWFTTWSGVLIAQVKQLVELNALPRKCMIEQRQTLDGRSYYTLVSAKKKATTFG
jgi:hypothetical protein